MSKYERVDPYNELSTAIGEHVMSFAGMLFSGGLCNQRRIPALRKPRF